MIGKIDIHYTPSDDLDDDHQDQLASASRMLLGTIPVVGTALGEAITHLIPQQRHERIVAYIRDLATRIEKTDEAVRLLKQHATSDTGAALIEESILAASKAPTHRRRVALSSLLARSLSQPELDYTRKSQILRIVADLGDGELLTLLYYSLPRGDIRGGDARQRMQDLHPDVLGPTSTLNDTTEEERELAAYQASYDSRLNSLGLVLFPNPRQGMLSELGKLVLRNIEIID